MLQVVHVEMIRAYGRLVRMVVRRGKLLRKLQSATAALQKEAQDWQEVPVSKEVACYKIKDQIDQLSRDIQVNSQQLACIQPAGMSVSTCPLMLRHHTSCAIPCLDSCWALHSITVTLTSME